MQIVYQTCSILTNWWLTVWTEDDDPEKQGLYLGVYGGLGGAMTVCLFFVTIIISLSTLTASKRMHRNQLNRVLRSPMSFFDTTPVGRILNRFSKDIDICDVTLPFIVQQWINTFSRLDCFILKRKQEKCYFRRGVFFPSFES